ncbi:MAG: NUDIX domain-containing protein [Verrucomicrobia bacterium]|nr:NUDIX domain-containing protein [Verrucomicrobiota bacterium]
MNPRAKKMFAKTVADPDTRVKVGTAIVLRDHEGRVLLEKRKDCGLWGLPGGKVDPGESVMDCALREAIEETGLTVRITRLVGIYSEPKGRIVTYPNNGEVVHLVDVAVEAEIVSGKLSFSDESEEMRFFPPDSLPEDLMPPSRAPLRDALAGRCSIIR